MKRILLTVFVATAVIFAFVAESSRAFGGQCIVNGTITDEQTGEPVSVTLEFRSPEGKKIKIQSNSATGKYQQVLEAETAYEVVLSGGNAVRKIEKIAPVTGTGFVEHTENFKVKILKPGMVFDKFSGFSKSGALDAATVARLDALKELMKFNRNVHIAIKVNAHDKFRLERKDPVKPVEKKESKSTKKDKKSKDKAKPEPVKEDVKSEAPAEAPANDNPKTHTTVDERVKAVKDYLAGWERFSDRIEAVPDYSTGKPGDDETIVVVVVKLETTVN